MPFDAVSFALSRLNLNQSVFNPDSGGRAQWRKVRSKLLAGEATQTLLCVGDSKTAGVGSNAVTAGFSYMMGYPNKLATVLARREPGFNPITSGYWGSGGAIDGNTLANFNTNCGVANAETPWTQSVDALGGKHMANSSSTTAKLFVNLGAAEIDKIDIWYTRVSGGASFTWKVDAGSVSAPTSAAGSEALLKLTISLTRGVYTTLEILRVAAAAQPLYIHGIWAYDSTEKQLRIMNAGESGSMAVDWTLATHPYAKLPAIGTVAPDHTIIGLGTNEAANTPAALTNGAFDADMATIIAKAKLSGGVTLLMPAPMAPASIAMADYMTMRTAIKRVSLANDVSTIDLAVPFRTYAEAFAAGFLGSTVHETGIGYQLVADTLAAYLLAP